VQLYAMMKLLIVPGAAGVGGFSGWLVELHNGSPLFYAAGVVAFLLVLGASLGVLFEWALSLFGLDGGAADHESHH